MFYATHLIGFGAGGGAVATVTYTDHGVDSVNRVTYTFSGKSIGTAASNRYVAVGVGGAGSGGTTNIISSVTIGGVSATKVVQASSNVGGNAEYGSIWIAAVPTGTTADVVVTWGGTGANACGVVVWAITATSSTATDTGSSTDLIAPSDTINVSAGGVAIAYVVNDAGGARTFTWTGLTENIDEVVEAAKTHSGASDAFSTAQTGMTVTATASAGMADACLVMASFGP